MITKRDMHNALENIFSHIISY